MKHWVTITPFAHDGQQLQFDVDEHDTKDVALAFAEKHLLDVDDPNRVVYVARVEHSLHVEHKVRVEGVA